MWTRTGICKSYSLSYRAGIAQAAADEAAMMAPPSPPPEPAANTSTPSRSRRTAAPASKPVRSAPKKAASGASPRRKSKPSAGRQQQNLVLPDADPSLQPPTEPGVTESPAPEVLDDTPAELSAAIAAWQQFDEHAKDLLVGKVQSDNMVQLLSNQVEDKQADQVIVEVELSHLLHSPGSRDTDYMYCFCWFFHRQRFTKATQTVSFMLRGLKWDGYADGHMHCSCASQAQKNYQPESRRHSFHMFCSGVWHEVQARSAEQRVTRSASRR